MKQNQNSYVKVMLSSKYKKKIRKEADDMDLTLSSYLKVALDYYRTNKQDDLPIFNASERTKKNFFDSLKRKEKRTVIESERDLLEALE